MNEAKESDTLTEEEAAALRHQVSVPWDISLYLFIRHMVLSLVLGLFRIEYKGLKEIKFEPQHAKDYAQFKAKQNRYHANKSKTTKRRKPANTSNKQSPSSASVVPTNNISQELLDDIAFMDSQSYD